MSDGRDFLTIGYRGPAQPGTEDFIEVADAGEGGWDWEEIRFFYSPSARRYFWMYGAGCSCDSWEDQASSIADLENGDRAAAIRAIGDVEARYGGCITPEDKAQAAALLRDFVEPAA